VSAQALKAVTTCAADNKLAQTLAVAAFAASIPLAVPQMAQADVAGLTPCKDSAAFMKREKSEIKALNRRLKQVDTLYCAVNQREYFFDVNKVTSPLLTLVKSISDISVVDGKLIERGVQVTVTL
jgi:hypothetical protein